MSMSDEQAAPGIGPSDATHRRYLGTPAPDDPWSPDYVAGLSAADDPSTDFIATRDVPAPARSIRRSRARLRSVAAVGGVVALVVFAFSVIGGRSPRRQLSASGAGRLPNTVVERWAIESVSVVDSTTLLVVDDVVVHQTSKQPFSDVVAIDIETGRRRWTVPGDRFDNMRLVGPFADQVVVLQAFAAEATIIGLAASNGELLWSHTPAPRSIAGELPGSDLIAVSGTSGEDATRFVDALTGAEVGVVPGSPLTDDLNGRWYFRQRDGVVSVVDVRDHWNEPTVVGVLEADARSAAVGEHLLAATDRIRFVGRSDVIGIRDERTHADLRDDGILPAFDADVVRLTSAGGPRVLLSSRDTVYGGRLDGTELTITWSRAAQLRDVLLVADEVFAEVVSPTTDGADFTERAPTFVLDTQSGEVITEAGGDLGSTDLLGVVNGLIVPRRVSSFTRLVGVGLDGTDLWALPPGEIVAIGDEVIVTVETTGSNSVVRAYASA